MDARLLLKKSAGSPQPFTLRSDETVIGRQTGCQIRVPSGTVSRRHCRLTQENDLLWAEDLGSANGTIINGRRIKGRTVLRPGDWLQIGVAKFLAVYQLSQRSIDTLLTLAPTPPAQPKEEVMPEIDIEVMDEDLGTGASEPEPIESDLPLAVDVDLDDVPPPAIEPVREKKKKRKSNESAPAPAASLEEFDVSKILAMRRKTMLGKGGSGDLNDLGE
ncbi:MAG: FHA domain-containing protein [Gemmataceae bacterium]|nr:FHA domain-containing protein [Gemmataceae bacterium]